MLLEGFKVECEASASEGTATEGAAKGVGGVDGGFVGFGGRGSGGGHCSDGGPGGARVTVKCVAGWVGSSANVICARWAFSYTL